MPSPDHILILAAGHGTRMGGPKALMLVAREPWWLAQSARLAPIGIPATWVVSPRTRDLIAQCPDAPQRLVPADPNLPMFDSLLAGVRSLKDAPPRGVFVLPIDTPAPDKSVFDALSVPPTSALRSRSSESQPPIPVIPANNGTRGHPVYLPWPWIQSTLLPAASSAPSYDRRLDRLMSNAAHIVETDDPAVLTNLNTPADVDAWLAIRATKPR